MYSRVPPPRATWFLEHLAAGEREEALTGDLIEEYHSGRSNGWYWQQVVRACIVSWSRGLSARVPVIFYALVWSILAPTWYVLIERSAHQFTFNKLFDSLAPFSLVLAPIVWTIAHAAFLWAGLLIYQLAHAFLGRKLRRGDLRRAFWLATLILPPVYFVTFVFVDLYQYSVPALAHARLAATSLAQITDVGLLSDLIRVPYFVALLSALWGTIHPFVRQQTALSAESGAEGSALFSHSIAVSTNYFATSVRRFFAWMVAASLINASIAIILLCDSPASAVITMKSLLIRAIGYIAVGVMAGTVGAYAYWQGPWSPFRDRPPVPFTLFVLACCPGWIWVPATIIFSRSLSAAGAFVAMIGAFTLASALRRATYAVLGPAATPSAIAARTQSELFETSLYRAPTDLTGYTIAISIVTAGAALAAHLNFIAGTLLALSAALFAWQRTIPREHSWEGPRAYRQASALIALMLVPAVVVTAWALLDSAGYQHGILRPGEGHSHLASSDPTFASKTRTISYGSGGYTSVILWPNLPKKQIIPPVPSSDRYLAPGSSQPLIIHFDGEYTYVQPPDRQPGPGAHRAHGTPLDVAIKSNNDFPVVMTARQGLATAISVSRCREIDVQIENLDNIAGPISMALLLTDPSTAKPNGFYLGQQPILSMEPVFFFIKASPLTETLRFSVPQNPSFKSFTGITVMFLPDIEHRFVAPKIAIEQFQLLPR